MVGLGAMGCGGVKRLNDSVPRSVFHRDVLTSCIQGQWKKKQIFEVEPDTAQLAQAHAHTLAHTQTCALMCATAFSSWLTEGEQLWRAVSGRSHWRRRREHGANNSAVLEILMSDLTSSRILQSRIESLQALSQTSSDHHCLLAGDCHRHHRCHRLLLLFLCFASPTFRVRPGLDQNNYFSKFVFILLKHKIFNTTVQFTS